MARAQEKVARTMETVSSVCRVIATTMPATEPVLRHVVHVLEGADSTDHGRTVNIRVTGQTPTRGQNVHDQIPVTHPGLFGQGLRAAVQADIICGKKRFKL